MKSSGTNRLLIKSSERQDPIWRAETTAGTWLPKPSVFLDVREVAFHVEEHVSVSTEVGAGICVKKAAVNRDRQTSMRPSLLLEPVRPALLLLF